MQLCSWLTRSCRFCHADPDLERGYRLKWLSTAKGQLQHYDQCAAAEAWPLAVAAQCPPAKIRASRSQMSLGTWTRSLPQQDRCCSGIVMMAWQHACGHILESCLPTGCFYQCCWALHEAHRLSWKFWCRGQGWSPDDVLAASLWDGWREQSLETTHNMSEVGSSALCPSCNKLGSAICCWQRCQRCTRICHFGSLGLSRGQNCLRPGSNRGPPVC